MTWLVGVGPMARDYAAVMTALGHQYQVIGRGELSAETFERETGQSVRSGGVDQALREFAPPRSAIVAVGIEHLADVACSLIAAGTSRVLVEKPGGLDLSELHELAAAAQQYGGQVLIAYNRRFFSSVLKAEEFIKEDGGLRSTFFEFTEWATRIEPLQKGPGVKERWLIGNSSHVIDLAFSLAGLPESWNAWHSGALDWHPSASRFSGAGVTDRNVLFSYLADWEAPGRWNLELLTEKRRLILCPMEGLAAIESGSLDAKPVELDDQLDRQFRPGLYRQVEAFLSGRDERFCTLADQIQQASIYNRMAGY